MVKKEFFEKIYILLLFFLVFIIVSSLVIFKKDVEIYQENLSFHTQTADLKLFINNRSYISGLLLKNISFESEAPLFVLYDYTNTKKVNLIKDLGMITVSNNSYINSSLIKINPTSLFFSFNIKTENVKGKVPVISVVELDKDKNYIQEHKIPGRLGTNDWKRLSRTSGLAQDCRYVYVKISTKNMQGYSWLDNFNLLDIYEGGVQRELISEMKNKKSYLSVNSKNGDFNIKSKIIPFEDHIRIDSTITNEETDTVSVGIRLPFNFSGFYWGQDINNKIMMNESIDYINIQKSPGRISFYPFASVSNEKVGLGLAVPADAPRLYRIFCNQKGCFVLFDFGLTNKTLKLKNSATFSVLLYSLDDPDFHLRSTAEKYYKLNPSAFERRLVKNGGWFDRINQSLENVSDFGLMFDTHGDRRLFFNKKNGIYSFKYIEPWNRWYPIYYPQNFSEEPIRPSDDTLIETLVNYSAMEKSIYVPGFYEVPVKQASKAILKSSFKDKFNNHIVVDDDCWHSWGPYGKNYPRAQHQLFFANVDKDYPGGLGKILFKYIIEKELLKLKIKKLFFLPRIHGFYLDSFGHLIWCNIQAVEENYDKEAFSYVDIPLIFSSEDYKPVQWGSFNKVELAQEISRVARNNNLYLRSNLYPNVFGLALVDETGHENKASLEWYAKTKLLMNNKPITVLDADLVNSSKDVEAEFKKLLLYGIFPGGGDYRNIEELEELRPLYKKYIPLFKKLDKAGWKVVPDIRINNENLLYERYGNTNGTIYIVVHNPRDDKENFNLFGKVNSIDPKDTRIFSFRRWK